MTIHFTPTWQPTAPRATEVAYVLRDRIAAGMQRITSDRCTLLLMLALATLTVLAANALNPVDHFVNTYPRPVDSELFRTFLIYWPDTVASRAVALPVLGLVALFLALQSRSWRPIALAAGSVFTMICLVSAIKLVISRSHPRTGDPSFFVDFGANFSFPSGHGANAILIYGVALYLVVRYRAVRPHMALRLGYAVALIAMVQFAVSAYLQFHWATDLVAGMVAGALVLRMTVLVDRLIPEGWSVGWWPFLPTQDCMAARKPVVHSRPIRRRPAPRAAHRAVATRPLPARPARVRSTRPPKGEAPFPPL